MGVHSAGHSPHPGAQQGDAPASERHLLEIINDFLGHAHVLTTQIYARANLEMKRKALARP